MEHVLPTGHSKGELRHLIEAGRMGRDEAEAAGLDARRSARVLSALERDQPRVVAAYVSREREPSTLEILWELAESGVPVLLPALSAGRLTSVHWAWWSGEPFGAAIHGIPQPMGEILGAEALSAASIIIMPGLAATRFGGRLGVGGGWYDRALIHAAPTARTWLLLNDDEIVESLPTKPHDQPVTDIITDRRWVHATSASSV